MFARVCCMIPSVRCLWICVFLCSFYLFRCVLHVLFDSLFDSLQMCIVCCARCYVPCYRLLISPTSFCCLQFVQVSNPTFVTFVIRSLKVFWGGSAKAGGTLLSAKAICVEHVFCGLERQSNFALHLFATLDCQSYLFATCLRPW